MTSGRKLRDGESVPDGASRGPEGPELGCVGSKAHRLQESLVLVLRETLRLKGRDPSNGRFFFGEQRKSTQKSRGKFLRASVHIDLNLELASLEGSTKLVATSDACGGSNVARRSTF
jgi:hypothetical protein